MKNLVLILLIFAGSQSTFAQGTDFVLLKRGTNQKSQIRYYPGEEITYKSTKINYFVTDVIKNIDQNFIYLSENILSPESITEIDIRYKDRRNGTLRALTALTMGAGVILLGAESINSLYHEQEFSISNGVGLASGILIGTGLALLPLRYKTFNNSGRNKIQLILMRMD
ncbi:hypothetical protein LV84_03994 [Algoriphagus ratkowskyi]|uniref:Uncharacterized protein n=1 Tax=Algoriphagus ratkowskyi TaxID=57028 RepID=A0A2W7SJ17_9BACT|nr:hypothetical protein [Algoriphagus ratkowskyi]PZX50682.1 hypothetical protein LV84_03994 [Algoriphagus ratkowskyi]TXD80036.1 hypothetical protein ESW18_02610 [Algoriphagus ratkowskyi]